MVHVAAPNHPLAKRSGAVATESLEEHMRISDRPPSRVALAVRGGRAAPQRWMAAAGSAVSASGRRHGRDDLEDEGRREGLPGDRPLERARSAGSRSPISTPWCPIRADPCQGLLPFQKATAYPSGR